MLSNEQPVENQWQAAGMECDKPSSFVVLFKIDRTKFYPAKRNLFTFFFFGKNIF